MKPPNTTRTKGRRFRNFIRLLVAAFFLLNVFAFFHARSMGHYAEGAERTDPPEELSALGKAKVLLTGPTFTRPENDRTPEDFGLDYETLYFGGAFDVRLEAWQIERAGNRGLILMFHGHGASKDCLLPAAEALHKMNWDCALVDFHGSGGSGTSITSVGWHEASDVAAAFHYFEPMYQGKPIVLHGMSMGSAAILRAVHQMHIRPDGVLLELPYDNLLNAARTRFRAMQLPSWPAAELIVFYGGVNGGFNGFELNPTKFAQSVTCPALVLNAEHDLRAPPKQATAVFKNLSGPKTRRQFAGIGHRTLVNHDPQTWNGTVSAFLEQVAALPIRRISN